MRGLAAILAALFMSIGVLAAALNSTAQPTTEDTARQVEYAFREAMQAFAYREFWRLWDISTRESRLRFTQKDFEAAMEKGGNRPAAGGQVEDLSIKVTSPHAALVTARITLEHPLPVYPQPSRIVVRSFVFSYEDGRWRPHLSDFLGLSSRGM